MPNRNEEPKLWVACFKGLGLNFIVILYYLSANSMWWTLIPEMFCSWLFLLVDRDSYASPVRCAWLFLDKSKIVFILARCFYHTFSCARQHNGKVHHQCSSAPFRNIHSVYIILNCSSFSHVNTHFPWVFMCLQQELCSLATILFIMVTQTGTTW